MAGKWYVKLPNPVWGEEVQERTSVQVSDTQVIIAAPGDFILTHANGRQEVVQRESLLTEYQEIDLPMEPPANAEHKTAD